MVTSSIVGTWSFGPVTQTADTVIVSGLPPYPGPQGAAPFLYGLTQGTTKPNWTGPQSSKTHVTNLIYSTGATAHKVALLRPFNFCFTSAAAAINQAVLNIDKNPGTYSANYRYPTPSGNAPCQNVADNGIAAGDYCAYQLADGTWVFDTVSSVSTLAITMTTSVPNITGGGVLKGAPFFFFGVVGDKDPATGLLNPQITVPASQTQKQYQDYCAGLFTALHAGDPLIFYSPNGTNAGTLDMLGAIYTGNP